MTKGAEPVSQVSAATEIGQLVNRLLALAPTAGLYVGIKIEPARRDSRSKPARAETHSGSVHESGGAGTAIAQTPGASS